VAEVDPDSEQHLAISRHPFVPLRYHFLDGYRTFDRIDHRGKLEQHTVPRALHEASPVLRHESIDKLAVFTESTRGADLVETHEPRVTRDISGNYGWEPRFGPRRLVMLGGQERSPMPL